MSIAANWKTWFTPGWNAVYVAMCVRSNQDMNDQSATKSFDGGHSGMHDSGFAGTSDK